MKPVKIGFLMGIGIGLMMGAAVMFAVSVSELNKNNDKDNVLQNSPVLKITDNDTNVEELEKEEVIEKKTGVQQKNYKEDEKKDNKEKEKYVEIIIPKGTSSTQVAKMLKNKGIIKDNVEFHKYLEKKNKTTKINVGTFKIKENSDYDEIIKVLTL